MIGSFIADKYRKVPGFIWFLITWAGCLGLFAGLQPVVNEKFEAKILPGWEDYVPFPVRSLYEKYIDKKEDVKPAVQDADKKTLIPGVNNMYLKKFFDKLAALEKKGGTVRIYHTGDSTIYADNLASTIKRNFHRDFGDGGRGLVNPYVTPANKLRDHDNLTLYSNFLLRDAYTNNQNPDPSVHTELGFMGSSSIPKNPLSATIHRAPEGFAPWTKIGLILRAPALPSAAPFKFSVNLTHDKGRDKKDISIQAGECGKIEFEVNPTRNASIDFEGTPFPMPYIDGVNLETGRGVAYSTAVCTGYELTWLGWIPPAHLKCGMRAYSPDLVLYHFGVNEASRLLNFRNYSREILIRDMGKVLSRMKENLPDTDFIIIGPIEFMLKTNGVLSVFKQQQEVREIQMQMAEKYGMAFYDMFIAAGGEGHMLKFISSGLATSDYVHLSTNGGKYMGDIFYNDIFNSYQQYQGHQEKVRKQQKDAIDKQKDEVIRFNSPSYVWFFLIVMFVITVSRRFPAFRVVFMLAASYLFYASSMAWPLILIFSSAVLDFYCGIGIQHQRQKGFRGTGFLALSLVLNLGILFVFKYYDFAASLVNGLIVTTGYSFEMLKVALPIAISFYTFETVSYSIDVWRGDIEPERNFFKFALFLSFFPHLVAGPIVRAHQFLPGIQQGRHFEVTYPKISQGLFLILCGLLKKMTGDYMAVNLIDRVFDNPAMFSSIETLVSVYGYGMQIYCDFSGYTDMALGSALLLGFQLPENFRRPYQSLTLSEFWRRWHISLSTWFRDYLYISLGGNRKHVYFNLIVTMFLCGLWHGAGIQFILWGTYHGFFLIIERLTGINKKTEATKTGRVLQTFVTLHIVLFGWLIFRSRSWENFTGMLSSMASLTTHIPNLALTVVIPLAFLYAWHMTPLSLKERIHAYWDSLAPAAQGVAASIVTLVLYHLSIAELVPFIYFQF